MRKKQTIRINLNRKESLLKRLLTADLSALKEEALNNLLALVLLAGLLLVPPVAVYYYMLKSEVGDLKKQVEAEKRRRERLIEEIRRLEAKLRTARLRREVYERVKEYNEKLLALLEKGELPRGVSLQNFSACFFKEKVCSLEEGLKKGSLKLGKPYLQMDLVVLEDKSLSALKDNELILQTFVNAAGVPLKRVCIEVKEGKEEGAEAQ